MASSTRKPIRCPASFPLGWMRSPTWLHPRRHRWRQPRERSSSAYGAAMEAPHVPCHSTRSLRSCRLAGADAEAEFPHGDRQGPRGSHRGVVPGAEDGAGGRREDQRCTDQADGRDETRASRDRYDDARAAPSASRFGYPGDDNGMIMGTFGTPSPCARASVGAGQRARSTGRGPSHVRCGVVWRHPGHVHALEPRHRFRDYGYPGYCGASPAVKQQLTCRGARSPCPAAFGHRGRVREPGRLARSSTGQEP